MEKLGNEEGPMWVAVPSIGFGAAIGVNVVALWLTVRFGQLHVTVPRQLFSSSIPTFRLSVFRHCSARSR